LFQRNPYPRLDKAKGHRGLRITLGELKHTILLVKEAMLILAHPEDLFL
jgi:hypothetical protein